MLGLEEYFISQQVGWAPSCQKVITGMGPSPPTNIAFTSVDMSSRCRVAWVHPAPIGGSGTQAALRLPSMRTSATTLLEPGSSADDCIQFTANSTIIRLKISQSCVPPTPRDCKGLREA